mgnify:CR=1 FL=1
MMSGQSLAGGFAAPKKGHEDLLESMRVVGLMGSESVLCMHIHLPY